MNKHEFVEKHEKLYDYVLMEYEPLVNSTNDYYVKLFSNAKKKLRLSNILFQSIKGSKIEDQFIRLITNLRNKIGMNQTVWGIKMINQNISWELYFYNHRQPEIIKLNNITDILAKSFNVANFTIDESMPYRMFSFDISEKGIIDNYHIYFGKYFDDSFHAWSYNVSEKTIEFENHYEFFIPKNFKYLSEKLLLSSFLNSNIDINQILIPNFMKSKSICVATKNKANGIYFSGLSIDNFLFFLKKFNYPQAMINYVEENKNKLDYIQFDIGFDYFIKNNSLSLNKSGFYGTI